MKAFNAKMLVPLVAILLVAPFFAVALLIGARAVALSHGTQDDLLLVALALAGVAVSIINAMSRRSLSERRATGNRVRAAKAAREASVIHLGY